MAGQAPELMTVLARMEMLDSNYRQFRRIMFIALTFSWVAIILLIVATLQARSAAGGPAKEFALQDEGGKRRAWLGMAQGVPALEFYDEDGKVMGGLKMARDDRSLLLFDEKARPRAMLGVLRGEPRLVLYDEGGKPRASLLMNEAGSSLVFRDDAEKPVAVIGTDKNGPRVVLRDEKGKEVFTQPPPK